MTFATRNAYYLRISRTSVLPLYLYLDERHLEWMNDLTLQHVLSDLKPLIPFKMAAEADEQLGAGGPAQAKKGTVDVHRGEHYQFAYFFRQSEPHSVLVKSRNFTLGPTNKRTKRTAKAPAPAKSKKRKTRPVAKATGARARQRTTEPQHDDDEYLEISSEEDEADTGGGAVKNEEDDDDPFANLAPDSDDEDAKPKPVLSLSYQNFELSGRCLCVIVEPWPPIRAANRASRAPSVATALRESSIAPPGFVTKEQLAARARTPLFLPDDDDDDDGRGQTPFRAPEFPQRKILPPVPAFDAAPEDEDEDDNAGLMQFSQTLHTGGIHGEVDDDDFEGAVFFADADEGREM